jgi:hypothetical protein
MVLERVEYKRVDLSQTEAEMDAVVGMHWLAIIPHGQKVRLVCILLTMANLRRTKLHGQRPVRAILGLSVSHPTCFRTHIIPWRTGPR